MRRLVDADKLMDGLGRLATDTDLCKRYGNCTPWIPYSAVRKLISDMILEAKESCDDAVSRKAMLEKIRTMQTYKLFAGDDMLLIDQAEAQTELMMLPSAEPERKTVFNRDIAIEAICDEVMLWFDVSATKAYEIAETAVKRIEVRMEKMERGEQK